MMDGRVCGCRGVGALIRAAQVKCGWGGGSVPGALMGLTLT